MHNSFCSVALSKLFCGHKKSYISNSVDVRIFICARWGGSKSTPRSVFTHGDDDDVEESKANTQRQE
jgi:hypothetical protein